MTTKTAAIKTPQVPAIAGMTPLGLPKGSGLVRLFLGTPAARIQPVVCLIDGESFETEDAYVTHCRTEHDDDAARAAGFGELVFTPETVAAMETVEPVSAPAGLVSKAGTAIKICPTCQTRRIPAAKKDCKVCRTARLHGAA